MNLYIVNVSHLNSFRDRIVSSVKDAPIGNCDISLHLSDLATVVGASTQGIDTKWTSSCGCDSDLPFIQWSCNMPKKRRNARVTALLENRVIESLILRVD
jgi:hypothetical protein